MLSKMLRLYQERSFRELLELCKGVAFVYAPYYAYLYDDEIGKNLDVKVEGAVTIQKGSLAELEKAGHLFNPLPWEFRCHAHDGVTDFFVAKRDNEIQHISWIYRAEHPNRLLLLGDGEVEIKYCLTLPEFRGRKIYPAVIRQMVPYLRAHGVDRIFMCVRQKNHPSIRGIEKAGFRRIGRFKLIRVFGVQISPRLKTRKIS